MDDRVPDDEKCCGCNGLSRPPPAHFLRHGMVLAATQAFSGIYLHGGIVQFASTQNLGCLLPATLCERAGDPAEYPAIEPAGGGDRWSQRRPCPGFFESTDPFPAVALCARHRCCRERHRHRRFYLPVANSKFSAEPYA